MHLINLHSEINERDGIFYGINLMMDDIEGSSVLLGTFDTVDEIMREINEIYNTDLEIYCVTGFNPAIYNLKPERTMK